jgi:hypothetical protein
MEVTTAATTATKIHRFMGNLHCIPTKAVTTGPAIQVHQAISPSHLCLHDQTLTPRTTQLQPSRSITPTITTPTHGTTIIPGILVTSLWGITSGNLMTRQLAINLKRTPLRLYLRRLTRMLRSTRSSLPSRRRGTDLIYPKRLP